MADEVAAVGSFHADEDADLPGYRPVSSLAVFGLLLGVVSLAAFWHLALVIVAALAIAVNAVALRRIALDPLGTSGRAAALAGLALAIASGTGEIAHFASHQWRLEREARAMVENWFDYLAKGAPHKAHQLTLDPEKRLPLDDALWEAYRNDEKLQRALHAYVNERPVRTLLELGSNAQVRFYQSEPFEKRLKDEATVEVYAVTFPLDGKTTTIFVRFEVVRVIQAKAGRAGMFIVGATGGYRPKGWADAS